MWNILNAFPRPSHSWEERQVPAHPIQAVTREGNDSPRPALQSHCLPQTTVGSQLQLDPASDPGLARAHPFAWIPGPQHLFPLHRLSLPGGEGAVLPSLFAAWCAFLLSFKEFKGWLLRSILPASICFLYLALTGNSCWLYI